MKLFIYPILLIFIAPCNSSKNITGSSKSNIPKATIIYQTTPCFGRCPLYTLTISGETNTATFVGTKHTEKIGTYVKSISNEELNAFVKAFDEAQFFSLNDEYLGTITDFPIKYITYSYNGKTKKIKTRSGVPEVLTKLEKRLNDYAVSEEGWKKTEDSSNSKD